MINKFKSYLEKEFRAIAPTQEAMDYREEILGTLLDREQEYRIKGMEDEEMIYNLCIDSLGDFRGTLVTFEQKREQLEIKARKLMKGVLVVIGAILLMGIVYLAVSFATGAWGKTWLILVCGPMLLAVAVLSLPVASLVQKKEILGLKLVGSAMVTLLMTSIYFILLILTSVTQVWLIFLAIPIAIMLVITIISAVMKSRMMLFDSIAFVQVSTVLIYVILALRNIIAWHPYWLIALVGVFINVCIAITALVLHGKKKEKQVKLIMTEEDYYTTWRK